MKRLVSLTLMVCAALVMSFGAINAVNAKDGFTAYAAPPVDVTQQARYLWDSETSGQAQDRSTDPPAFAAAQTMYNQYDPGYVQTADYQSRTGTTNSDPNSLIMSRTSVISVDASPPLLPG